MTRTVILVPWRTDHSHRERLWRLARARWEAQFPDWPIYEGASPKGHWNRAAAANDAARQAGAWDIAVVIDADVMLSRSQVLAAVETATTTGKVTWAHRKWGELTRDATHRLLDDPTDIVTTPELDIPAESVKKVNPISWSCCMAVPRKVWDALGGMDERFEGWGGEDTAFAAAVQGLHGWARIEGTVWNLWHDSSGRQPRTREYVANMRLRDRYAYALRRDQRLHDREVPGDEGERLRDLGNIERAETVHTRSPRSVCNCGQCAKEMGLPDWSRWWPSLEELVARTPLPPSVALVVHSGGDMAAWPTRKEFLRQTLASLNERVVLPQWERKVVLSDWGEAARLELDAIADEAGFYVKDLGRSKDGSGIRLGYTGSMQAEWRYVAQFVKADYVFRTEDDFAFDRDVDIPRMAEVLSAHPELVQMALLRDENPQKIERGGLLGHPLDEFTRRPTHLEHQRFFTCNPSLMRTGVFREYAWPSEDAQTRRLGSERVYSRTVFGRGMVAGIWGHGEQWVSHLGWDVRSQVVAAY